MNDKYINDIEPMIISWLKSGNENTTQLAYDIAQYIRYKVKPPEITYKIKATSFTTGRKKWFILNKEQYDSRCEKYPAWMWNDGTLEIFNNK